MLQLEEALEKILSETPTADGEQVALDMAHGRYALKAVTARVDLPVFDNSAMDGYAVRADDVLGASPEKPVRLRVIGTVAAGGVFAGAIKSGECVRIFTGSPLPEGADAVVMQEDTRSESQHSEAIEIFDKARPWENIRLRGEDVKRGAVVVAAGDRLTAGRIGLLAAAGVGEITVGKRPVVGLLATGSELVERGQPLRAGQIHESNRVCLAALFEGVGAIPKVYPLVKDDLGATTAALEKAFGECDLVISSGGASVGEHDYVKQAFANLGGSLDFWKVAIKPGKPFIFGTLNGKHLHGLPGNPVSALVTFLLLVRPPILRMQGAADCGLLTSYGTLAEDLVNRGDRRHFMRVTMDSEGAIHSAGYQASHALSSLAAANGLVDVPPNGALREGDLVKVLRW